jgi:hypothetical protein
MKPMAFIAMSQNLNMGGSEEGASAGPGAGMGLMLLFVGRMIGFGWLIHQLLRGLS